MKSNEKKEEKSDKRMKEKGQLKKMDEDHKTSFKTKTTSDSYNRFSQFPTPIITQCKKVTLEAKQEKTGKSEERNKGKEKRKDYIEKYEEEHELKSW